MTYKGLFISPHESDTTFSLKGLLIEPSLSFILIKKILVLQASKDEEKRRYYSARNNNQIYNLQLRVTLAIYISGISLNWRQILHTLPVHSYM
jgi:hypothetical protein